MHLIWHVGILVVCVFECASCLRDTRGRFTKLLIFAGFGLIHGLVPILTPRSMTYYTATGADLNWAGFVTLVGMIMFALGWRLMSAAWRQPMGVSPGLMSWVRSPYGQAVLKRTFWASMVVGVVFWYAGIVASAGSLAAAMSAGRFEYRFEGGRVEAVLTHISSLMFLPGFLGFFLTLRYRTIGVGFAIFMAALVFMATKGARGTPIGLMGGLVFGYVLTRQVRPAQLAKTAVLLVCLVLLSAGLYEVRKVMSRSTLKEMGQLLISAKTYQGMLARDPFNYHQMMVAAVHNFPANYPYLNGATYRRILLFYLPSSIAGDLKPVDTNMVFGRAVSGMKGWSKLNTIPPSVPGDAYINFWGLPGVVVVMFLNGVAVAWLTNKMDEGLLWFVALGSYYVKLVIMGLRGQPYDNLVVFVIFMAAAGVLLLLCGWKPRQTQQYVAAVNQVAAPVA